MRHLAILVMVLAQVASAQPFPVGTSSITFYDASRDRNIGTTIHYPGASAGTDVAVAGGVFPVLVFGHGFVMVVESYGNFRDHLVPRGYILVLPSTEGGIPANHGAFGQDLVFLANALQEAGAGSTSPFAGHVAPATALMGHSMGGGASVLGAAGNTSIQTLVNFAAAETGPSAIAAAQNVSVPTLMFAGSDDCVTPPGQHQIPIYEGIGADCKAYVSVLGGGHCYFANTDLLCSFGESSCSASLPITREQQQSVVNDLAGLWLDHFLKGDQAALPAFLDSLSMSTRVSGNNTCLSSGIHAASISGPTLFPVPADELLTISGMSDVTGATVIDQQGRVVVKRQVTGPELSIRTSQLAGGSYRIIFDHPGGRSMRGFVVLH